MPEPKSYDCRYDSLAVVLAAIDGRPLPEALPKCDRTAAYATHVDRGGDGQQGVIYTRQCAHHDELSHAESGYVRSIALRFPRPDPTP